MSESLVPALIALASACFYALGLVTARLALSRRPVVLAASVSVPTAAATFWLLSPFLLGSAPPDWTARLIFAGIGAVFPIGVTLLSFESNRRMGPSLAGAVGNTTPLFALTFAALVLGETLSPTRALGAGIVILGVLLVSWPEQGRERHWPLWVLLVPLAAALVRGAAQPAVKLGLARWPDPYAATLIGYTVSAGVILALRFGLRSPAPRSDSRERVLLALTGLANGASLMLMYVALSRGSVGLVAPLVATYPLITLALSAVLLGEEERLHAGLIAGIAATVGGVALILLG